MFLTGAVTIAGKTWPRRPAEPGGMCKYCCDAIFFRSSAGILRHPGPFRQGRYEQTEAGDTGGVVAGRLAVAAGGTARGDRFISYAGNEMGGVADVHWVTFTCGRLSICARDTVKGICVVITVEAPEARTNWNVVPASYVPAGSMA